jgi:prepilin-type N-terminal cleavage/methylation domain-containing protein
VSSPRNRYFFRYGQDGIRAGRAESAKSGFTILEVCVVLFIVAVLFIAAVPPAARLLDEEKLHRPIRELQSFARIARRNAILENRPYEVLLLNDTYLVRPVDAKNGSEKPIQSYDLPPDVTFAIKRLGDSDFLKQTDARWYFSSNGLCEPMDFLFRRNGDWVRFQVDPLTATFQNQQSFIH